MIDIKESGYVPRKNPRHAGATDSERKSGGFRSPNLQVCGTRGTRVSAKALPIYM